MAFSKHKGGNLMKLNFDVGFKTLQKKVVKFLDDNPGIKKILSDCQLDVGLASNSAFGTPSHAIDCLYVGDAAHLGDLRATEEIKALYKQDKNKVSMRPRWNPNTKKYDMLCGKMVQDALSTLGAGQLISPWNQGWFQGIFKQPLSYSNASKLVKMYSGSDPWCEVMNLQLAGYSGFAAVSNAGAPSNVMNQDVNVQAGLMTTQVINITVTYALTLEETERAKGSSSPFAGALVAEKQRYANYVLNLIKDYLIYYGNEATGTIGLLSVNSIDAWADDSLTDIYEDAANTTKGSTAYQLLFAAINDFLTSADNKFDVVRVAVSPLAYNFLTSLPYSDIYNPNSTMKVLIENYIAGLTKDGKTPKIEVFPDPLLKPSSIFNAETFDYMVITAPEIGAGADDTPQDLILFGAPLDEFVYPAIPQAYNTQHKMLKRVAGIFAPVPQAVQVYSGFGV
jgi:hypothetical protein